MKTSGKDAIIEATLALIDERGGATTLGLRELARAAGCAAPNIYNHFDGLEDLFASARARILELYMPPALTEGSEAGTLEAAARAVARSLFGFAQAHPGWYGFLFLERIDKVRPQEAEAAARTSQLVAGVLARMTEGVLKPQEARRAQRILHGYIHGELCRLVSKRILKDPAAYGEELVENVAWLMQTLTEAPSGDDGRKAGRKVASSARKAGGKSSPSRGGRRQPA